MSRIVLAGGWLWAWGTWHAIWLAALLWGGVVLLHGGDPRWVLTVFAALYTVFFPMELLGVRGNRIHRDHRARTLSEFRQFLPVTMTDGSSDTGWRWIGYSGLADALIIGGLLNRLAPVIGTGWAWALAGTASSLIGLWLISHFGWRHR